MNSPTPWLPVVPWAQHLGTPDPGQAVTLWERARNWPNTQPPHNAPARSRQTLDPAAESRSTATVYTPPTDDVLRGLDGEPARRAVRHIAVSAMNVTTVTLNGTSTTADARAALLGRWPPPPPPTGILSSPCWPPRGRRPRRHEPHCAPSPTPTRPP